MTLVPIVPRLLGPKLCGSHLFHRGLKLVDRVVRELDRAPTLPLRW